MSAAEQKHPYHLVDPSPWPITGSISAFLAFGGTALAIHDYSFGLWAAFVGGAGVILTMFLWWRDVIREAEYQGHHTKVVQLGLRYGMALFIASEVMFFSAFFWAFFDASLFATAPEQVGRAAAVGHQWPPKGIKVFDAWDLPFLNTLVLLTSGVTVTWAHHALRVGNRKGLLQGLALTIILGITFTALQATEYSEAPFSFRTLLEGGVVKAGGIYPSTFFMATGFHGFHVIIGTTFLIVCFFRALAGHFKPDQHFGFEAAAWYWHFVDVVWVFLFFVIYLWGSSGAPIAVH
jgi:cytochrome c oxidase subunit 3